MRKTVLLVLSLMLCNGLFCDTVRVIIPNYEKMYFDGISEYRVEVDSDGVFKSIVTPDNTKIPMDTEFDKGKFELLNCDGNTIQVKYGDAYYRYENGVTYVSYLKQDNYQFRYEYQYNDDNTIGILFSNQIGNYNGLNEYEVYSEKYVIDWKKLFNYDMEININNFLKLFSLNAEVATLLIPLIFSQTIGRSSLHYSSTSELHEGETIYTSQNLSMVKGNPWASANGYGIGDKIIISLPSRSEQSLIIYNGYQSSTKPYLFKQNSRVKKMKIVNKQLSRNKEFLVMDIPEGQELNIDDLLGNIGEYIELEIEILEIYKGSKYSDLCIQAILPKY